MIVEITHDPNVTMGLSTPLVIDFLRALENMHNAIPIKRLLFMELTEHFSYHLETRDGRFFDQFMIFDIPHDPLSRFSLSPGWRLGELRQHHNPVLNTCIQLRMQFGITRMDCAWR